MRSSAFVLLGLMLALPPQAQAQGPPASGEEPGPWVLGVSVGLPRADGESYGELLTLGLHASHVRPGRVGADFFVGTLPRVIFEGVLPVAGRAGAVLPLPLGSDLLLLPGAGVGALGGVSSDGAGFGIGLHTGASLIVGVQGRPLLRGGATWHYFAGLGEPLILLEFGVLLRRD